MPIIHVPELVKKKKLNEFKIKWNEKYSKLWWTTKLICGMKELNVYVCVCNHYYRVIVFCILLFFSKITDDSSQTTKAVNLMTRFLCKSFFRLKIVFPLPIYYIIEFRNMTTTTTKTKTKIKKPTLLVLFFFLHLKKYYCHLPTTCS